MALNWHVSREDMGIIKSIVDRAIRDYPDAFNDRLEITMDLTATHLNGCPLDLPALLAGPGLDFGHDLAGIRRHIDRTTGALGDCFWPRFALKTAAV
jgi:hypothetical protein